MKVPFFASIDIVKAVSDLTDKNAQLQKEIEQLKKEKAKGVKSELKSAIKEHNGIQLLSGTVELDGNSIKDILFQFKGEVDNFVGIIGGKADGKCTLSVIASDNLVKEKDIHAGNLVRSASKHIQGGGGGQPFFATAGGKNPDGLEAAIAEIEASLG